MAARPRQYYVAGLAAAALAAGFSPAPPIQIIDLGATERTTLHHPPAHPAPLPELLREFSFEERAEHPWDMPPGFQRTVGVVDWPGGRTIDYTSFGAVRFDDWLPSAGAWSLRFDIEGGSMAVALAPGEVLAISGVSHRVTVWVRTRGLHHAVARLAAHYVDDHGQQIEDSRAFADATDTAGEWRLIELDLTAAPPGVASIVIELQVLQPADQRARTSEFEPLYQDVSGSAWFDEIRIERREVNQSRTD